MEIQLNSSETDVEDSEPLNTEEVFKKMTDMLFEQKVIIIQRRKKCKWY